MKEPLVGIDDRGFWILAGGEAREGLTASEIEIAMKEFESISFSGSIAWKYSGNPKREASK